MDDFTDAIKEIRQYKAQSGLTYKQLAELCGVPLGTVTKIMSGATKNPGASTLEAIKASLIEFINDESAKASPWHLWDSDKTTEDYYALPDDVRVELIDGIFYNMGAPTTTHQRIIGSLFVQTANYISSIGGGCEPFLSPVDVQLDKDNKTMLQPDFIVVCDPSIVTEKCIFGAPDWVVEITSKSSKTRDYIIKLGKYKRAGVREYWIIDPSTKTVNIYTDLNTEDMRLDSFSFTDEIPVGIYKGELRIKLS